MITIKGSSIKGAILDMDGVLWRSQEPLCNLPRLFQNFEDNQIDVALATNNGTQTISQYVEKLARFGVAVEPRQVVTSTMATAHLMRKSMPNGGPVYISGPPALVSILADYGFYHSTEEPLAIAAGLRWDFTYDMMKDTSLMIQRGLPFYFTNPDPSFPTPDGLVPGAGAILAALETATGAKAMLAGKPHPYLFEVALERMELDAAEVLVAGDRLTTDIIGGFEAGCKTVFVLTGVNTREDLKDWEPKPDVVLDNIQNLFEQTEY